MGRGGARHDHRVFGRRQPYRYPHRRGPIRAAGGRQTTFGQRGKRGDRVGRWRDALVRRKFGSKDHIGPACRGLRAGMGEQDMERRTFLKGAAATAGALVAAPAIAQTSTEISFYYPVAVGGPITKLIDTYAADFEKEYPGIKVKPIYAGTYQETIVKALT